MKTQVVMTAMLLLTMPGYTCMAAQPDELPRTDASAVAGTPSDAPVEVVVVGRQPGPPLWKVSNGDKVLWIFAYLDWVPQDMIWDSNRVARVIAQSQEVLGLPETGRKISPLVLLNPITVRRSLRNVQRIERNPDGGTLEENLPPELYARFAALQAHYFPGNDYPGEVRPSWAGASMIKAVREQEGLVPGDDILKAIQRLVRRHRGIRRTEVSAMLELGDNFEEYQKRWLAAWESVRPEQEQACFERQVRHMEEDLGDQKRRANRWAQGYIDDFRNVDLLHNASLWPFNELHACAELLMGSSSIELEALVDMITRVDQQWLDAAERALAANASTFAILGINELLADDGLLSRLKTKGYDVREP